MNMTTWLGEWLECTVKPTAKERTYTRYHEIVAQHLIPAFGGMELSELTQAVLQKFTSNLSAHGNLRDGSGLSPNSVNSILAVMQNAMKTAYQMGYTPAYTAHRRKYDNSTEFYSDYFGDRIDVLVAAITEYHQTHGKHQSDEGYLFDLLK